MLQLILIIEIAVINLK